MKLDVQRVVDKCIYQVQHRFINIEAQAEFTFVCRVAMHFVQTFADRTTNATSFDQQLCQHLSVISTNGCSSF